MYARTPTRPKPRKSQAYKFPAPVYGWLSNVALSEPGAAGGPGAAVLDNFFPKASSVKLRRGKQLYCTLGDGSQPCLSTFSYVNGNNQKLFASTNTTIYDITSVVYPYGWNLVDEDEMQLATETGNFFGVTSTEGFEASEGHSNGRWITAQFATSGGVYLVGVNGEDTGFIYDGSDMWPLVGGGISRLNLDPVAVPFEAGETATGSVSAATGTVYRAGDGFLYLQDITGTFQDNEAITGSAGGAGTSDGITSLVVPGLSFGTLTSADMSYVWAYKNRLYFAQKNSMTAWYASDVDSIGGEADFFPLAGVFGRGGSLLFGSAWSLDGTADAGLSEQCVFVSSEGEVAVYSGTDPSEAATWSKVGTYRIGRPLGNRAHFRGGGDLAIATSVGLVPLSKAVSLDVTSLAVATVSYRIADAWTDALTFRGYQEWQCEVWPEQKMAIICPPQMAGGADPVMFVSNTETGAWARFTNWQAYCTEVFQGVLYFGSENGQVFIGNVAGNDNGEVYTGKVVPLFQDMGSPSSLKIGTVSRAVTRANGDVNGVVSVQSDFDEELPASPDATAIVGDNNWGTALWGMGVWGGTTPHRINQEWQSAGGTGYALSLAYQVSSGSIIPLDDEMIRMELHFNTAEAVT